MPRGMRDFRARIRDHRDYGPGLFAISCEAAELAASVRPGQFAMLGVENRITPYLRRAFSIADIEPERGAVEFLIKTVGSGTRCLEELPAGAEISVLAPLGNAFNTQEVGKGDRVAIVAGGVGIAPFPILLRELSRRGAVADLFFGGRTSGDLAYLAKISAMVTGVEHDCTDDGSLGFRGRVTDLFAARLAEGATYRRIYACGPTPMFKALARVLPKGAEAEFSTEAPMGCGFGVCLACVLPAPRGGYVVSCKDGPILPPQEIDWSRC